MNPSAKAARLFALAGALASFGARAGIELPLLFSDGAVLQRDQPIPIWGDASQGTRVHIAFDGVQTEATADKDGHWMATLPAHSAGGPYTLRIVAGKHTRTLHDVLVGDVWLASGQSNMELRVEQAANAATEIAAAKDGSIRQFEVPNSWSAQPQRQLAGGSWIAASPQAAGGFSAVAYYFARDLHARTGVPVGIINSSWGGSRIEAWMDAQANGTDVSTLVRQVQQQQSESEELLAATRMNLARWPRSSGDDAAWSAANFNDREWATIQVPGPWEQAGYFGMDGVAWYRTQFALSAEQARQGVTVSLGRVDDSDQTWVNGTPVGGMQDLWDDRRIYAVPAAALRAGANVLAVRVIDTGSGGGIHGDAAEMYVQFADQHRLALPAQWKFMPATVTVGASTGDKEKVQRALVYNRMIHPLQPYGLRGAIWYQGESNATADDAWRYRDQFATLIRSWRGQWGNDHLPFLWVQLANYITGLDTAAQSPWAMLRESQSTALALPATAQATAIDIGEPNDLHPHNKQAVGHRLALAARHVSYGESLVFSGPIFRAAKFDGRSARIEFDLQRSALAVRDGGSSVHGFELAGADRRFHPAEAHIRGEQVVVSSDAVTQPRAVRYAWRDNPVEADLVNAENLPSPPFRSDAW